MDAEFGLHHLLTWLEAGDAATLGDVAPALPAVPFSTTTMSSLSAGYPPMQPGGLFVAVRGAVRDGHDFVESAFENGARAALVARMPDALRRPVQDGAIGVLDFRTGGTAVTSAGSGAAADSGDSGGPALSGGAGIAAVAAAPERPLLVLVDDPLSTWQRCAGWWRRLQPARVLAVGGAVGKTTTKELLATVLAQRYRVLRTPGNLNNEYGLPHTLLQLGPEHERAVVEIGISAIGEMAQFASVASPDGAVMTRVAAEHLEFLRDLDTVEREEGELVARLGSGGVAALNVDDARVARMAQRTRARVVRYGEGPTADVRAVDVQALGLDGLAYTLLAPAGSVHVRLPLIGRHFVTASLGAAALALEEGCSLEDVAAGLAQQPDTPRLQPRRLANGVTLLDDAYNASPDSSNAALDVLAALPGRRVAVLGDMFELGDYAVTGHRLVGAHVPERADLLLTVGTLAQEIAAAARAAGMPADAVRACASNAEAVDALRPGLKAGDVILVKGSHGMHMEEIVRALAESRAGAAEFPEQ